MCNLQGGKSIERCLRLHVHICLMWLSHLMNGWKQKRFIFMLFRRMNFNQDPSVISTEDCLICIMHFRAGQMVSTKGQRRNGLRHELYQKCKQQHQHFHQIIFRAENGQLNGNKEMEQLVRPTFISSKVTFGLKQTKTSQICTIFYFNIL